MTNSSASARDVLLAHSLNDYYDPSLKQARLRHRAMAPAGAWRFAQTALEEGEALLCRCRGTASGCRNMAAQAGVRYRLRILRPISRQLMGFSHP